MTEHRGWLSTRAAAAYTSDDPTTLRKAAEAGELAGSQRIPGRSPWKFRTEDLDRWVRGEKPASAGGAA